ncbi:MAG: pseudouridine synthase [Gammaproteobacteria bacterium]|nr:pseudouridine synthase [Gammaproteobacteria bacterium]
MAKIIAFNKPFGTLCQFSGEGNTLAKYIDIANIYPAGRLDKDSEGLVILTDDGKLQNQISSPKFNKSKIYVVQVDGEITNEAVQQLSKGITLNDGSTRPAKAKIIAQPEWLWPRVPPIRQRKNIPTSWLQLSISEGRNRQVRRMTAHVGFPTLRLIRTQVGEWQLNNLKLGSYVVL